MNMSKLSITEAIKIISVSESTLRRDIKSGKVTCELDPKGRKLIDVSELERVYKKLKSQNGTHPSTEKSEPVNDSQKTPSMNGNESQKIIELLEGQVQDLKEQLDKSNTEKTQLLDLANNLQKQNELLMLPSPKKKGNVWSYFRTKR